ncbi:hypothetical protein [Actinomadura flavalba]|uniref:hypothetical protein n=1 Tax=Actinomadura flavalba TaxID=1120938 RepID=UPI00039D2177|nr:hypothetical protein [Actinomadura flavalba]
MSVETQETRPRPHLMTGHAHHGVLRAIGRRWPAWFGLAVAFATFADGMPGMDRLAALLISMPLFYLGIGAVRRSLGDRRTLAVQLAGLVVFVGLGVAALVAGGTAGWWLLAAGWLGHALWDGVHFLTRRVVPRGWSEWCGVIDLCGTVAIGAVALTA